MVGYNRGIFIKGDRAINACNTNKQTQDGESESTQKHCFPIMIDYIACTSIPLKLETDMRYKMHIHKWFT